jgi:CheY-like chemotaxis protein
MPAQNPIIFLLEDCPVTGLLIERTVLKALPSCRLVWSRSVEDAMLRMVGIPIDLLLVDIGLPDGSGLDFLVKMSEAHPSARAIVMTASTLPEYEMNSAALGVLDFLQKPLQMAPLLEKIRAALNAELSGPSDDDFSAILKNVTPVDILQLKCLGGDTTMIEFESGGQSGFVNFQGGEIVHAEVGETSGLRAVYQIISWKRGKVSEHPSERCEKRTIDCPWQTLLMNAAYHEDESNAALVT